LTQYYYL